MQCLFSPSGCEGGVEQNFVSITPSKGYRLRAMHLPPCGQTRGIARELDENFGPGCSGLDNVLSKGGDNSMDKGGD